MITAAQLNNYIDARTDKLRISNDRSLNITETSAIRGRIAELKIFKKFLADGNKPTTANIATNTPLNQE